MAIEKAIYTARAKAMVGRVGTAKSDDGQIDLKLDRPVEWAVKGMAPTRNNCLKAADRDMKMRRSNHRRDLWNLKTQASMEQAIGGGDPAST
jgi:hypothetical protein